MRACTVIKFTATSREEAAILSIPRIERAAAPSDPSPRRRDRLYINSPPASAMSHTNKATEAATFQPAVRAVAKSDGRLIAGPANSNATAAPVGNPADSKLKASGISRNVGKASGTARVATNRIAMAREVPPANASADND